MKRTISAEWFCSHLDVNVDNDKLSDADFRKMVYATLEIVEYPKPTYRERLHTRIANAGPDRIGRGKGAENVIMLTDENESGPPTDIDIENTKYLTGEGE